MIYGSRALAHSKGYIYNRHPMDDVSQHQHRQRNEKRGRNECLFTVQ